MKPVSTFVLKYTTELIITCLVIALLASPSIYSMKGVVIESVGPQYSWLLLLTPLIMLPVFIGATIAFVIMRSLVYKTLFLGVMIVSTIVIISAPSLIHSLAIHA